MTQETKKPLWQQLNETRTQGTLHIVGFGRNDFSKLFVTDDGRDKRVMMVDCGFLNNSQEATANIQYAALAVNELANLAEALEKVKLMLEQGETVSNIETFIDETLNRIS